MKFMFLGTAAANAFPEAFCRCPNCQQARSLGGPSLRLRSAALVNDDLLIDLGPDVMAACQIHRCSLQNVQYCLQTHPHADHLDTSHLLSRSAEYGTVGAPVLNLYASRETLASASNTFERDMAGYSLLGPEAEKKLNLRIRAVEPLEPFTFGRYRVTAFPANHAPSTGAMLYAIETDGHCVLYGTDTAELLESTWQAFHLCQMCFDVVILDHTYGPSQPGSDHLSAHQVIDHIVRMRREGILHPKGRVFATHIAHEGNPAHPQLSEFARRHGYDVAYDGLVLDI